MNVDSLGLSLTSPLGVCMISEWAYYGFLTIMVEGILYVGYLLAKDYWKSYVRSKIRKQNPHLEAIFDFVDDIKDSEVGEVPVLGYLVYPTTEKISTMNTAVYTTLQRAFQAADPGDEVIQVMTFPPNAAEQEYLSTFQAKDEIIKNLFKVLVSEEESDDESSTEQ